jgi:hypothetical protein
MDWNNKTQIHFQILLLDSAIFFSLNRPVVKKSANANLLVFVCFELFLVKFELLLNVQLFGRSRCTLLVSCHHFVLIGLLPAAHIVFLVLLVSLRVAFLLHLRQSQLRHVDLRLDELVGLFRHRLLFFLDGQLGMVEFQVRLNGSPGFEHGPLWQARICWEFAGIVGLRH